MTALTWSTGSKAASTAANGNVDTDGVLPSLGLPGPLLQAATSAIKPSAAVPRRKDFTAGA